MARSTHLLTNDERACSFIFQPFFILTLLDNCDQVALIYNLKGAETFMVFGKSSQLKKKKKKEQQLYYEIFNRQALIIMVGIYCLK